MFELVYPAEPAPLLPRRSALSEAPAPAPASEMLPVVEESGLVIGQASRESCHTLPQMLLHPVVHLHILDRYGNIYLQKRAPGKKLYPNYWDTAVGGHVIYGELVQEALFREAEEELALTEINPTYLDSYLYEGDGFREISAVFAVIGNFNPVPQEEEVSDGKWWSMADVEASIGKGIFTPFFEFEFTRIKPKLLSLL